MNKPLTLAALLALALPVSADGFKKYADIHPAGTETILHAWSWNFDNIAKNMKRIADAGYDMVQTSRSSNAGIPKALKECSFRKTKRKGSGISIISLLIGRSATRFSALAIR